MRNAICDLAARKPGTMLQRTVREMVKAMAPVQGDAGGDSFSPQVKRNLATIVKITKGKDLTMRSERGMETLAEALDALLSGNLARAGDTLVQRFKALEWTVGNEVPWSLAEHLELIGPTRRGLVSANERAAAQGVELKELKLKKMLAEQWSSQRGKSAEGFAGNREPPSVGRRGAG